MRKAALSVMAFAALLSLLGCTRRTEIFSGEVDGRRLTVEAASRRVPFSDTFWPVLRWGNLPPIAIDSEATSDGPPYSLDVYAAAPVAAADGATDLYGNTFSFESSVPVYVMLYLDPAKFSRSQFEEYAAFFETGWPQVAARIELSQGYREVVVVGLVYGRDVDFVQRYRRPGDEGVIEVWTNGEIHFRSGTSIESTNLSGKVQMPGNRIVVHGAGRFTSDDLREYLDASGRAVTDAFQVVEER